MEQRLQLRVTVCVTVCASLPFKEEVRNSCGCCGEWRLRGVTEEEAERRWEREERREGKSGEKGSVSTRIARHRQRTKQEAAGVQRLKTPHTARMMSGLFRVTLNNLKENAHHYVFVSQNISSKSKGSGRQEAAT